MFSGPHTPSQRGPGVVWRRRRRAYTKLWGPRPARRGRGVSSSRLAWCFSSAAFTSACSGLKFFLLAQRLLRRSRYRFSRFGASHGIAGGPCAVTQPQVLCGAQTRGQMRAAGLLGQNNQLKTQPSKRARNRPEAAWMRRRRPLNTAFPAVANALRIPEAWRCHAMGSPQAVRNS